MPHLKRRGAVICAADLNSSRKLGFRVNASKNSETFRGKSGSVSFVNITHQSVEESQLVSTPYKENTGSLLWILAPIALISSLLVPQFFIVNAVEDFLKNEVLAGIIYTLYTSNDASRYDYVLEHSGTEEVITRIFVMLML